MNVLQLLHDNNLILTVKPITDGNRKYVFVSIENKKGYVSRTIPEEDFNNEALINRLADMLIYFLLEHRRWIKMDDIKIFKHKRNQKTKSIKDMSDSEILELVMEELNLARAVDNHIMNAKSILKERLGGKK